MGIRGELFSTRVLLQNRTYFFNVKENRTGDLYLNIVESKNRETSGFDRQSVILFADDLQDFLKGFDESLRVLEKAARERKRAGDFKPRDNRERGRDPDNREGRASGRESGEAPKRGGGARAGSSPRQYGEKHGGNRPKRSEDERGGNRRSGRETGGSSEAGPKRPRRVVVKKSRRDD
jgi:hypothetical protein